MMVNPSWVVFDELRIIQISMDEHDAGHDTVLLLESDGYGTVKGEWYWFVGLVDTKDVGEVSVDGL